MEAFEILAGELFWRKGYWVQNSVKVPLTKEDREQIERPSCPRWEIDLVAFSGRDNQLLAIECKSYLDSTGVTFKELTDTSKKGRYKLFCEPVLREVVLERLRSSLSSDGYIPQNASVSLGMVAGKLKNGDQDQIEALFDENGWQFFGPSWIKAAVRALATDSYHNEASSLVAKILLR